MNRLLSAVHKVEIMGNWKFHSGHRTVSDVDGRFGDERK